MDDQIIKPNSDEKTEDTSNDTDTTEENQQNTGDSPVDNPPEESSEQKPKKPKKKLWLLILLALLLFGSAAAYWYFFMKEQPSQESSGQQDQTDLAQATEDNRMFFQIGKKIISYDVVSKTDATVLTSSIPDGANVIDLYADSDTWRAYYDVREEDNYSVFYIEKEGTPKEVYKSKDIIMPVAANAKLKTLAYTEVYGLGDEVAEEKTKNRHYVIQNDATTKLFDSVKYDQEVEATDATSSKYTIEDISADGKKALMQLHSCFYCDGPSKATGMEIDLDSKKTTLVYQSDKAGTVRYADDDSYLIEKSSGFGGLGYSDEPLVAELLNIKKAGDEPTTLLSVNENDWAFFERTARAEYVAPEIKLQNYSENGLTSFGNLYETKGSAISEATKLAVTDLDGAKFAITGLGKIVKSCVGVTLGDRDDTNGIGGSKYQVGVICKDDSGSKYQKIDELSLNSLDNIFEVVKTL